MAIQHSNSFRDRINASWPISIRSICTAALAAADNAEAACKPLNRGAADFKPVARRALVATGKAFTRALRDLAEAKERIANERAAFRAKALENADPFSGEIRAHVRGLSLGDKAKLLFGVEADKQAQIAVLQAPSYLSGVHPDLLQHVDADFFGRHHPAWTAEQAEQADALTHAESSLAYARETLRTEAAFDEIGFVGWLENECSPEPSPRVDSVKLDADRLAQIDAKLAELT